MSRGVVYDPVVSGGASKVAQPPLVQGTAVVYDPVCAYVDSPQTAVTTIPPTR